MLARSAILRRLLAILIALWMPACLCQAETDAAAPSHPVERGQHQDGDDGSDNPSDDHDHCPGHDHNKSGCECPQLTATLAKADQNLNGSLATIVAIVSWTHCDWPLPASRCVGCTRPFSAVPRPPTSLLRMHCALIV